MSAIGKVSAVFTASTSGLTSGVNRAASSMKSLEASARSLRAGMSTLVAIQGAQLFGSIASSASQAVGSLVRFGAAQAEVVDQTSKLAARLGMTFGELAGLGLAGELAGVSLDQIGAAATKADVALVKATNGSKTAAAAFGNLGLNVQELAGLNAAGRFEAIASAIAALPTEAQRAAAAVQIFGRAGADLLPLFNGGAEAIAEARAEAERFGLALTNAQGQDIEAMNDAFTRAQQAVAGVVQQVNARLAPAIKAVVDSFTAFISSAGGADIGQAIGDAVIQGARFLAGVADFVVANLTAVWQYVASVGGSWNATITYMQQVGAVFRAMFDAAAVLFLSVVRLAITPFSNIIEQIANLASFLPGVAGEVASQVAAASKGLRDGIDGQIASYGKSFLKNVDFATALKPQQTGQAIAGPLVTALDASLAKAEASSKKVDEASRKPIEIAQTVEIASINEALKGIDSRSQEGVSEMFRLMRGNGADVQQQQLSVLEQIAENTAGGDDTYAFTLD